MSLQFPEEFQPRQASQNSSVHLFSCQGRGWEVTFGTRFSEVITANGAVYRQMSRAATDAEVAKMIEVANATKEFSYSPYSHFRVGAAVLCEDGSIIGGTNVENCSYPCGSCAERTAIVSAIAQGKKGFKSIAVTADVADDFVTPCGFCRQFIAEFGNLEVILTKGNGEVKKMHISDLLPMAFTPEDLTK